MSGKVQSPKQRKANEAFAKKEDAKRGKPASTRQSKSKAAVKRTTSQKLVIGLIGTLIFGGLLYEILKIFA
ncbi:protein of unknown function [Taphrina deformans PYCC 5710]|uniref:Stress-associated endoplasmic reticulum protein n=1 Tax=Taphrina deformans (strain PYCC 5710 / ATCC 11124 / CBS 356.35 / IMI 108563 / JCM 9778 / NBRC 8474) TaxID=1097556 RepID=R4XHF6_TAPDE|nr:protein of unknown function [Taphrina deformans PYCC 5710]|eukprot:CCG82847.1 protein of unknown function [Taphrina deformans PYCC 5710]